MFEKNEFDKNVIDENVLSKKGRSKTLLNKSEDFESIASSGARDNNALITLIAKRRFSVSRPLGIAFAFSILQGIPSASAEINSFQATEGASWGGWVRSDTATVYAEWDAMSPLVNGVSNFTPDGGQHGVLVPNSAAGADLRVVPFTAGLTGTQNYYSPFNTPDFDISILTDAAHQVLSGEVTIALQVAILGAEIDDTQVRLNCVVAHADDDNNASTNSFNDDVDPTQTDTPITETDCIPFDSKEVLETGSSTGPQGEEGIDNEYLYVWRIPSALAAYTFDITATGSSLSLDALAIDIGPAPATTIAPVNVPIPWFAVLSLGLFTVLIQRNVKNNQPRNV